MRTDKHEFKRWGDGGWLLARPDPPLGRVSVDPPAVTERFRAAAGGTGSD
jgi:hypothetical protein